MRAGHKDRESAAVWARSVCELRRRRRATALLGLVLGLAGAVSLAAGAGARRTDSAYPRLLAAGPRSDILVNPDTGAATAVRVEVVADLPEVERLGVLAGMAVIPVAPSGQLDLSSVENTQAIAAADDIAVEVTRPNVLSGRLPDPRRADEAYVNPTMARIRNLHPGDRITLALFSLGGPSEGESSEGEPPAAEPADSERPEATSSEGESGESSDEGGFPPEVGRVTVTITAVAKGPGDFDEGQRFDFQALTLTPAFAREYAGSVAYLGWMAKLKNGSADVAPFREKVERLFAEVDEGVEFQTQQVTTNSVQRSVRPQAIGLAAFGALVAMAVLLMGGQALARQVLLDADDGPILGTLGMTRSQRLQVGLIRAAAVSAVAAAVGLAGAYAASGLFPVGPSRQAEPAPGLVLDFTVLAPGALVVALVLPVLVVFAIRKPLGASARARPVGRPSARRLMESLTQAGIRPTIVTGVGMALSPGRGRNAVPARTSLLSLGIALSAVAAATTFGASLDHLLRTPSQYGWAWDAYVDLSGLREELPEQFEATTSALMTRSDIPEISTGVVGRITLDGRPTPAVGVTVVRGDLGPTIVAGRAPTAPNEVALGTRTLKRLGLAVGDTVSATSAQIGSPGRDLRVVGRAVFAGFATYTGSDKTELGEGALVVTPTLRELSADFGKDFTLLGFAPAGPRPSGADLAELVGLDHEGLPIPIESEPNRPTDIVNLDRVRTTPAILAGLLRVLAAGTIGHALVVSVRRRRRDLALLKTLGFVRSQVRATVAWQATTMALVALIVGLPLGLAAGRWAWSLLGRSLGIPPQPVTPVLWAVVAVFGVVAFANLIAAFPARAAARTAAATALRDE